jgi:hypothetical protein
MRKQHVELNRRESGHQAQWDDNHRTHCADYERDIDVRRFEKADCPRDAKSLAQLLDTNLE